MIKSTNDLERRFIMSVYVKLGYEWKLTHEGEYYYLSNTLKQQLYQIDPGVRCQIIIHS